MRLKTLTRHELKYLIPLDLGVELREVFGDYVDPDSYGDDKGQYRVTSLYYDTDDHKAYWDKIDGQRFRRKVRLRIYGDDPVIETTPCYVEIKQRLDRTISKRRALLPYPMAAAIVRYQEWLPTSSPATRAVLEEVLYLHETLQMRPTCIVSYNRLAFDGGAYDPGLRITFDTHLQGRVHDLSLWGRGQTKNYHFLPPDWCVMEIKVNHRVPYWLTEILGKYNCTLRRVSKYCAALEAGKAVARKTRMTP